MKKLIKKIEDLTLSNKDEAVEVITGMVCSEELFSPLYEEELLQALSVKGEFLVLKMSYKEFDQELLDEKIKYKISQALSVVVCYEEDGSSFEDIKKFINYISGLADPKQNATFGIKRVDNLSENPITILFSGILPINQLTIHISQNIYDLIHSNHEYFKSRFREFRDTLSLELGTPILPVFPKLDKTLKENEAMLVDLVDGKEVSHFSTLESMNQLTIEGYLVKLFYIYISLAKKSTI